jgi:hypothetical protein
MDLLTHHEYQAAIKAIPQALEISQRTFLRYMYTRLNEKYSMPVDHLARLAKFFNCRIEEMLNYNPRPLTIKTLRYTDKIELAQKFKMVK